MIEDNPIYGTSGHKGHGRSDIVDIAAEKCGESEKAIKLDDGATKAWVPKSQIEENDDGTFSMPEWLANEKGFI